jgi:MscS family membrane protein
MMAAGNALQLSSRTPVEHEALFMKSRVCLWVFVLVLAVPATHAQTAAQKNLNGPKQNAQATTPATPEPGDPLGRGTPHGTLLGFLHAAQSGKYDEASQYLQLSKSERAASGEHIARQLHVLMDEAFVGRIGAVSDNPEGSPQPGVPHDHERIGVFRANDRETDVDLVRVSNLASGPIWLFSSQTLAEVPVLAGQFEEGKIESHLPGFLVREQILSTPLWRWIAFILLIPISFALAWAIVRLLHAGRRIWLRWRRHPVLRDYYQAVAPPARLILTVVFHWIGIVLLGYSLLFRDFYRRFASLALAVGVAWLVFRLINRWAEQARLKALEGPGYRSAAIVLLGQRIFKVVAVIVVVLAALSLLGVDITAAVAGLGIGSIAIAFAAQKTLENLLGGISILGDEVIRVGETCQIGDREGTVEDISLRSTRIRTLDRTELSVPNGQLANMNVENITRRDKSLFRAKLGLRQETSSQQLRSLLRDMLALLRQNPKVDPETARVRFIGFGESSLDVQVHCHILTRELTEFLAVREELLLEIMDLVGAAGVGFAMPSRALYMTEDQEVEQQRAAAGRSKVIGMRDRSS